ncbi:MAG: hypothetical protein OXH15_11080, partial [Gammaproteobacteria bacterium]|nr:hypothetical protein [Gammaproteobacteria bacterium]
MREVAGLGACLILVTGVACDRSGSVEDTPEPSSPASTEQSVDRLDARLDALLAADATVERVADGFAFIEGPVWVGGADDGHLLFS